MANGVEQWHSMTYLGQSRICEADPSGGSDEVELMWVSQSATLVNACEHCVCSQRSPSNPSSLGESQFSPNEWLGWGERYSGTSTDNYSKREKLLKTKMMEHLTMSYEHYACIPPKQWIEAPLSNDEWRRGDEITPK